MSLIKVVNEEPLVLEYIFNDYRLVVVPKHPGHGKAEVKVKDTRETEEWNRPVIYAVHDLKENLEAEEIDFHMSAISTLGRLTTEQVDEVIKGYKDAKSTIFMFKDRVERMLNVLLK